MVVFEVSRKRLSLSTSLNWQIIGLVRVILEDSNQVAPLKQQCNERGK